MQLFFLSYVVGPLSRRVGTMIGSGAAALGTNIPDPANLEAAIALICGVLVDLLFSYMNKRSLGV